MYFSRIIAYTGTGTGNANPAVRSAVSGSTDIHRCKLHALVYDILPPTTAIVNYAIGLADKLSANEQFFDDTY